jgi:O-succinylbenzoate synthase
MDSAITIDRAILRRVKVPMREPFRISNGVVSEKESIIIELYSGNQVGYGEASPMSGSFYSSETPETTWDALANDLIPNILSRSISSPETFAESLNDFTREPFAHTGIEGAVWDLFANMNGTTIREMLSVPSGKIASGLAVGIYDSINELLQRIERYLKDGYKRVKIKIAPGWDFEPLVEIRMQFGKKLSLMVDANGAYNFDEHFDLLCSLEEFDLMMIEQPFAADALEESAELSHSIETPICFDESADSLKILNKIIKLHAGKIINIKVQRVGGLWNAKKMHDRAHEAGLKCWLGTMPELGIASAQALEIATLPGFVYPTDIEASSRWFVDDIIDPLITITNKGFIDDSKVYAVDRDKLERYTIQTQEFQR